MLYLSKNKWEVYIGIPQDIALKELTEVLNKLGFSFRSSKKPPIFMYDSIHEQFIFQLDDMEISLVYVSADPLTRLISGILGVRKSFTGITYFSATLHKDEAWVKLKEVIKNLHYKFEKSPWNISWHPRFRYAFLLQQFNKYRWKKMLVG